MAGARATEMPNVIGAAKDVGGLRCLGAEGSQSAGDLLAFSPQMALFRTVRTAFSLSRRGVRKLCWDGAPEAAPCQLMHDVDGPGRVSTYERR